MQLEPSGQGSCIRIITDAQRLVELLKDVPEIQVRVRTMR